MHSPIEAMRVGPVTYSPDEMRARSARACARSRAPQFIRGPKEKRWTNRGGPPSAESSTEYQCLIFRGTKEEDYFFFFAAFFFAFFFAAIGVTPSGGPDCPGSPQGGSAFVIA
jgi:hypothetical protein